MSALSDQPSVRITIEQFAAGIDTTLPNASGSESMSSQTWLENTSRDNLVNTLRLMLERYIEYLDDDGTLIRDAENGPELKTLSGYPTQPE